MGHVHHGSLKFIHEIVISSLEVSTKHDDVCRGYVLGSLRKQLFEVVTLDQRDFLI